MTSIYNIKSSMWEGKKISFKYICKIANRRNKELFLLPTTISTESQRSKSNINTISASMERRYSMSKFNKNEIFVLSFQPLKYF